jgi:crossover junction endodeoxyribonuclease RusA
VTADIHLAINRDVLLTSNQRLHWAEKAKRTKVIRDLAWVWCKHYKYPTMRKVACAVEVTWPDKRRRDASNLMPTFKAAIDGCVDAELLEDDSDRVLRELKITAAGETRNVPGIACFLRLSFTEVS